MQAIEGITESATRNILGNKVAEKSRIVARRGGGAKFPSLREGSGAGKRVAAHAAVRSWELTADAASLYSHAGVRKYLNAAERQRFLDELSTVPRKAALLALVLATTGARITEALRLIPLSFDLDRSVIAFETLKRRKRSLREVPIPPWLASALDAHFNLAAAQRDPSLARRRLWNWHRTTAWRIVKRTMTQAGLSGCAASPRGLRHSFGVTSIQAGVPITLVGRWLGHSSLASTTIYTNVVGPEETAMAGKVWRLIQ